VSQAGAVNTQAAPAAGCSSQPITVLTGAASEATATAAAGYQVYYACCTYRHDSAAVELMWLVLTGQLPEAVLAEQRQQLQAVAQALHNQASAGAPAAAVYGHSQPESAAGDSSNSTSSSSSSGGAGTMEVPWSQVASTMQVCSPRWCGRLNNSSLLATP
jgi:hypothetical protein